MLLDDHLPLPLQIAELVLFVGSLGIWALIIQRWRRGAAIVPHEPRRPVPWKGVDLAIVLLVSLLVEGVGQQALLRMHNDEPPVKTSPSGATTEHLVKPAMAAAEKVAENSPLGPRDLALSLVVELLTFGVGVGWVVYRVRATPRDLGFDLSHFGSDLLLGGATFLATVLPVYKLQELLSKQVEPYQHPLIKAVMNRPDALMLALTCAAAVLVAPLAEEFFFRVLVQGCFEAVEAKRRLLEWAVRSAARRSASPAQPNGGSAGQASETSSSTAPIGLARPAASDVELVAASGPTSWPIIVTSTIFALMHWQYGMSSFPLFFFALGLGYVYQRTHRIWPSLVAHLLLNGTSMAILWYTLANSSK
jgi:membrane protease YdiL (CAAX protease family)